MPGTVIRPIAPSEGMQLRGIRLRALTDSPDAFGSTVARETGFAPAEWDERAAKGARGEERVTFVAEAGGRWVGLVGGYFEPGRPREPDLVSMWVEPGQRRTGVARQLVDAVVEWAISRGATAARLWVTQGNVPAITLYERCGFVLTGESAPSPSNPSLRELEMRMVLPG